MHIIKGQLKMLNFCNVFQIWLCIFRILLCDVEQLVETSLWKHFYFLDESLLIFSLKWCLINY